MELDQFSHLVGKSTKQLWEEGAMASIAPNWHLSLGTTQYYTLTEEPNFNIQSQWKKRQKTSSWFLRKKGHHQFLSGTWFAGVFLNKNHAIRNKVNLLRGVDSDARMGRTKQDLNFNNVFFLSDF